MDDSDALFDVTGLKRVEPVDDGGVEVGAGVNKRFRSFEPDAVMLVPPSLDEWLLVKAFNTNFAATLATGKVGGGATTTVLVAGDDADAKATLIGVVEAAGLGAVDAGSLKRAQQLEALGFLQLTLAVGEKIAWTGGFSLAR